MHKTSIKHNIIRENGKNNWTVEQLRKAILKEVQILEAGEETDVFDQVKKPFNTFPSTASLLTNASQIKDRNFSNINTGNVCKTKIVRVLFWSSSPPRMHSSSRSCRTKENFISIKFVLQFKQSLCFAM